MVKKKLNIWDVVAWVVLVLIFFWLVLKTLGVINTSLWLQYAPLYGGIYLVGWYVQKLESIGQEVYGLNKFRSETVKKISEIRLNCARNHI